MPSLDPRIVLVDDVRWFVDDRACVIYRTSADAVAGLRQAAYDGFALDELWLDHDLGGEDTIAPVLRLLDELDATGRRLAVGRCLIITSSAAGAHLIRRTLDRLGYPYERLYSLRGVLSRYHPSQLPESLRPRRSS